MTEAEIVEDTVEDIAVPGARYTVFITMHSEGATTFFDWERQLEELRGVLADHIYNSDWDYTQVYGPDAQGFSTPSIAIRASLTGEKLRSLMKELESEELRTWMPCVDIFVATKLNDDSGRFFEVMELAAA